MNAFCILFSDSYENLGLSELASERTLASVPFGGRYRLVDFVLSSLVGAQIKNIGIITRNKYGSLMDHIGWGKDCDLNRKNGGIKFLTPFLKYNSSAMITNKTDALYSVIDYVKNSLPEYCILCDSNIVMNLDFEKLLRFHKEKEADISFVYKKMCPNDKELEVTLDSTGKLIDTLYHQSFKDNEKNILLNVLVLKKELLLWLIDRGITYGWYSLEKNVIAHGFNDYKIYGYEHKGYASVIKCVEDFYKTNMDLLKKDVRLELFHGKNPVLTRIKDSVPTIYEKNAKITNSIIADGSKLDGNIENCIVFRDVVVKKGAVVKNSILMQGTKVSENAILSGVITDKDVNVGTGRILAGTKSMPFIITKGKTV